MNLKKMYKIIINSIRSWIVYPLISYFVIYVKIFQWMNVKKPGYFNEIIFDYLKELVNNVPYTKYDIKDDVITNLEENGFKIDKIPINSGTISLVYVGYLNNEKYAIKIKRTNID